MRLKALITAAALGGAAIAAVPASAMPIANLADATPANVEQVRMVCGPFRCFWRPGPRYGLWGRHAYAFAGRSHWRHRHMWGPRFYRY